ncbi:MAG TPA: glycosyltransferase family 2 protein, partial [Candidatus Bathyarchaeia archaeon]|nr:glycosyltransferase family 2 protein [Candidatus Bathyarchaeia archaeon]
MINQDELISILIPAYNVETFITACLESCLNQTYSNFEIVVVNDGSSDRTAQILQEKFSGNQKVKIIDWAENRGKISAFNAAFAHSSGAYVALMCADDISYDYRLARSLQCLKDGNYGLVCGDFNKIDASGRL